MASTGPLNEVGWAGRQVAEISAKTKRNAGRIETTGVLRRVGDPGLMVTVEPDLEPPRVPKYTPRPIASGSPSDHCDLEPSVGPQTFVLGLLVLRQQSRVTLLIETVVSPTWLP